MRSNLLWALIHRRAIFSWQVKRFSGTKCPDIWWRGGRNVARFVWGFLMMGQGLNWISWDLIIYFSLQRRVFRCSWPKNIHSKGVRKRSFLECQNFIKSAKKESFAGRILMWTFKSKALAWRLWWRTSVTFLSACGFGGSPFTVKDFASGWILILFSCNFLQSESRWSNLMSEIRNASPRPVAQTSHDKQRYSWYSSPNNAGINHVVYFFVLRNQPKKTVRKKRKKTPPPKTAFAFAPVLNHRTAALQRGRRPRALETSTAWSSS